jgi:hypothetical protein
MHILPHIQIIVLKQMQQYYEAQSHFKGRLCTGGIGQGKEAKNLNAVDVLLYSNEYRILNWWGHYGKGTREE